MLSSQPFMRDDTFLGVCYAVAEDFRISSTLLRLALCGLFFWQPVPTVIAYVVAGCLFALLHWLVPNPRTDAPLKAQAEVLPPAPQPAPEAEPEMVLAKAA